MSATAYKIRRKSDGLYSRGGTRPYFTKHGKAWSTPNALGCHLALVETNRKPYWSNKDAGLSPDLYEDCEVVVLSIEHAERSVVDVPTWKVGIRERREAREAERKAYAERI